MSNHLRQKAAEFPGFLALYLGFSCIAAVSVSIFLVLQIPTILVVFLQAPAWHFLAGAPLNGPAKALVHVLWHWMVVALLASFIAPVAWYVNTTAALLDSSILAFMESSVLQGFELTPGMEIGRAIIATPLWALLHGLIGALGAHLFVMFLVWLKLEA